MKVPTRLNPPRTLDPIITTLKKYYKDPVTKPPLNPDDPTNGKPSDHLVVLMQPITAQIEVSARTYSTIETRPINNSGLEKFGNWLVNYNWIELYRCEGANQKAQFLQKTLLEKYEESFPKKIWKVSDDDKPWFTADLKKLDRKRKREFSKHQKSKKWIELNNLFLEKCEKAKKQYYEHMVGDLKTSNPGRWHSKIKRMSEQKSEKSQRIIMDELSNYSDREQANIIAEHYAKIGNLYEEVTVEHFPNHKKLEDTPPVIEPFDVYNVMKKMNKKASTSKGDVPMRLLIEFSPELATPMAHLFNVCLQEGVYPDIFKHESITPVPKVFPPEKLKDLCKISGLFNCAKIFDKILGGYIIDDMAPNRDPAQYGNEKNLSTQHYLIKLLHRILTAVDRKSINESFAVIITMVDWAQAFDRQCHILGVQSFIDNGVRASLIPVLINYFQNRYIQVKWNKKLSDPLKVNGGGAQGGLLGILEYLSQNNDCASFLDDEDRYKYIDDLSILEIINLANIGLSSFNAKQQVPNDINPNDHYIPAGNLETQKNLDRISKWTKDKKMLINAGKTKYMMVNFSKKDKFCKDSCLMIKSYRKSTSQSSWVLSSMTD